MKMRLGYVFGSLAIAVIVCAWGVYTMPSRLVAERNEIYVQQANGYNRFVHKRLPDASWREFVRPSPDLLYSYLVFDTRSGAIAVDLPGYDEYWVNQLVDDHTDSFAYVGQRLLGDRPARFVLYSDQSPPFSVPEGYRSIKSPSPTGTFLLRYLVRSPDAVSRIDGLRRRARVRQLTS